MRLEGDAAQRAKGSEQASQGKQGTSAALGVASRIKQSLKGRPASCHALQGIVHFLHGSQGGVRGRRGLALGWLVPDLWFRSSPLQTSMPRLTRPAR